MFQKIKIYHGAVNLLSSKLKTRIIWTFLSILAVGLWASEIGYNVVGINWIKPYFGEKKVVVLRGAFFRTRTEYLVDGKEKMVFDTVVACSATYTGSKATGTSVLRGIVPNIVVQRTKSGGAVAVTTPKLCSEARPGNDWGYVRKDFIPLTMWFDDADDLTTGWMYATPAAYDNPRGHLKFVSATVGPATRQEWRKWWDSKDQRPANIVDPDSMMPQVGSGRKAQKAFYKFTAGRKYFVRTCAGYIRLKIAEKHRYRLQKYWPAHHPKYWTGYSTVDDREWLKKRRYMVIGPPSPRPTNPKETDYVDESLFLGLDGKYRTAESFFKGGSDRFSIATVGGRGGYGRLSHLSGFPAETYPLRRYDGNPFLTLENGKAEGYRWHVDMAGGKNNGLYFCQSFTNRNKYMGGVRRYNRLLDVDGLKVFSANPLIGSIPIFIENDTHIWFSAGSIIIAHGGVK